MKKIAVVQARISSEVAIPLDSAEILGLCRMLGIQTSFHDLNHGDSLPDGCELIYLSAYTVVPYRPEKDFPLLLKSVRELKKKNSKIVVGAPRKLNDVQIQELYREGVLNVFSNDTLAGFSEFLFNQSIDAFQVHPDYSLIPVSRYRKSFFSRGRQSLPVTFSRGCDLSCSYCPVEGPFKRMDLNTIRNRISWLIEEYGVNHLMIEDDLFNSSSAFVGEFCDLMDSQFPQVTWECLNGIHPGLMTPALWQRLAHSNCVHLAVGLECPDTDYLASRGKRVYSYSEALQGIYSLIDEGKAVSGYFLFDLLLEAPGGLVRQLPIMKESPVSSFHFSSLRPLNFPEKLLRSISLIYLHVGPGRIRQLRKLGYISGNSLVRSVNKIIGADA